jgi:hypothetical protein
LRRWQSLSWSFHRNRRFITTFTRAHHWEPLIPNLIGTKSEGSETNLSTVDRHNLPKHKEPQVKCNLCNFRQQSSEEGHDLRSRVQSAEALLAQKRLYQKHLRSLQQSSLARDILQGTDTQNDNTNTIIPCPKRIFAILPYFFHSLSFCRPSFTSCFFLSSFHF